MSGTAPPRTAPLRGTPLLVVLNGCVCRVHAEGAKCTGRSFAAAAAARSCRLLPTVPCAPLACSRQRSRQQQRRTAARARRSEAASQNDAWEPLTSYAAPEGGVPDDLLQLIPDVEQDDSLLADDAGAASAWRRELRCWGQRGRAGMKAG